MTNRISPVPLDEAHAGDLIGYSKNGLPLYLPGGGAPRDGEIIADSGDEDEPDEFGGDEDEDEDEDEPDEEPQPQRTNKPTYKQLQEQIARLEAGVKRNNQELASRRKLGQWADKHGIKDLDSWLATIGVDKETGQPVQGSSMPPGTAPTDSGEPTPAKTGFDEAEVERRVQLRLEQHSASAAEENDTLRDALRRATLESALKGMKFKGKLETALRVVDLGEIEVDLDGSVTGADKVAQSLQTEIPEWFQRANGTGATRTGGEDVDGGTRTRPPATKDSWEKQIVSRLRGS